MIRFELALGVIVVASGGAAAAPSAEEVAERLRAGQALRLEDFADDDTSLWQGLERVDAQVAVRGLRQLTDTVDARTHDLLLECARAQGPELRRFAADRLRRHDSERAVDALLRLSQDGDASVSDAAFLSLESIARLDTWDAILQFVTWEYMTDSQRDLSCGLRALTAILRTDPTPERVELLCFSIQDLGDSPRGRAALFSVLAEARIAALEPCLRYLLGERADIEEQAEEDREDDLAIFRVAERALTDEEEEFQRLLEPGGVLDELRPLSERIEQLTLEGLAALRSRSALPLVVERLAHSSSATRLTALRALRTSAPDFDAEPEVYLATAGRVLELLVDRDRSVRPHAHRWFRRTTRENLPLSYPAWRRWVRAAQQELALRRRLETEAADNGFDTVEEYLEYYPEAAGEGAGE